MPETYCFCDAASLRKCLLYVEVWDHNLLHFEGKPEHYHHSTCSSDDARLHPSYNLQCIMLYHDFYPKWKSYYDMLSEEDCSTNLTLYQSITSKDTRWSAACIDTALCLMDNSVKNVEAQTAVTGVLLGLLPSILSILGSSPVELALLSNSRPVLSLLLALAAPVVNPIRLFDYVSPRDILVNLKDGAQVAQKQKRTSAWIAVIQFVLAAAAVLNVTLIALDLYHKAYSVVLGCNHRYQIFIWDYLVAALWLGGLLALKSRSHFEPLHGRPAGGPTGGASLLSRLRTQMQLWMRSEFAICANHEDRRFVWGAENWAYFLFSQAVALGTVGHIFYGTAILSSYQFIAPIDALGLLARYVASAWISRLILRSELSGLAARTTL